MQVSEQDRALLQVKVQRDRLHRVKASMTAVIAREVEAAKQLLREGKKPQALLALKRKRYQEKMLERTEGQWANLSELAHSIEFAREQAAVFAALQAGHAALEQLNAQTKLEDVQALMDDTAEAVAYQAEVSRLLGSELSQTDEADIESTIAAWEAEETVADMPVVPSKPIAPAAAAPADPAEADEVEAAEASAEDVAPVVADAAPAKPKAKPQQQKQVVLAS